MRILHLNPFFFPYAGGIERRIRELGRRHATRHEVHVLTARLEGTPEEETLDGIQVHRLPSRFRFRRWYNPPMVSTPRLADAIRRIAPDVIDLHSRWAPTYAKAFDGAAARRVFTYHNTFGEGSGALGFLSRLNDYATRRFIGRSDRIVAVSRFIQSDLAAHGFPADRIRVVPNGVDAAGLRREAGPAPPDANRTLVSVGRIVDLKGFADLIASLPNVDADVRLVICGDGPERARLKRLVARMRLSDRVDLPGWVPEPEKLGLLKACLAYVQPSHFEAFGLAALEAIAMGAPVIATRVGGLPEAVGGGGLYVPPGRPAEIAAAVQRLRHEPNLVALLRREGVAQCAAYDWDRVAPQALAAYESAKV